MLSQQISNLVLLFLLQNYERKKNIGNEMFN